MPNPRRKKRKIRRLFSALSKEYRQTVSIVMTIIKIFKVYTSVITDWLQNIFEKAKPKAPVEAGSIAENKRCFLESGKFFSRNL